jgi:hypothetical protein
MKLQSRKSFLPRLRRMDVGAIRKNHAENLPQRRTIAKEISLTRQKTKSYHNATRRRQKGKKERIGQK